MAFNMMVWANNDGSLVPLTKNPLDREDRLEQWLLRDDSMLGLDLLFIGHQVVTAFGGRIDLLAMDPQGDLVIIELKRDRTPREIVAQILDYASWIVSLEVPQIVEIATRYAQDSLSQRFREKFGCELPESLNANHRMVIVASELDDSSERIVQYLSSQHSLDINVIFFTCFKQNEQELIARSWLMDPEQVEERSESRHRAPWSGYFFVNLGEGPHRNWDDCRKYGFVSAGNGPRYSNPLKNLNVGDKIFGYMKSLGYVGFGEVTAKATIAKDFVPAGHSQRLFDLPLEQDGIKHDEDNPDLAEWIAGVHWQKSFPRTEACSFKGMFANQNIVCRLSKPQTIEFLTDKFELNGQT